MGTSLIINFGLLLWWLRLYCCKHQKRRQEFRRALEDAEKDQGYATSDSDSVHSEISVQRMNTRDSVREARAMRPQRNPSRLSPIYEASHEEKRVPLRERPQPTDSEVVERSKTQDLQKGKESYKPYQKPTFKPATAKKARASSSDPEDSA